MCFPCVFLRLAINKYHQVWSLQVDAAMWTKGLNSKTHGKFPNQLAKSWTPVNSAADLLFWGWWNGDPGKLISMAGWKMDVWRMYFPWGCFGPLVVLVYRSVPDLLFKLITWPFVKTKKKSSNSVHNLKKKTQLLGNLFAIFLGGMETSYHSTICPGVFGTSISCGLKMLSCRFGGLTMDLDLLLFDADRKKWSQKSSDPNGG